MNDRTHLSPKKVIHPIPYFSQRSKHLWKERGFKSEEDAAYWEKRGCGIACLKMILDSTEVYKDQKFSSIVEDMYARGAYKDGVGWIHQGLADKLNDIGIDAQRMKIEDVEDFKKFIDQENVFIVSVGAGFDEGKKSGHLVVVVGYTEEEGKLTNLIVHHTSSLEHWEWPNKEINTERFLDNFSGNTIRVKVYNLGMNS